MRPLVADAYPRCAWRATRPASATPSKRCSSAERPRCRPRFCCRSCGRACTCWTSAAAAARSPSGWHDAVGDSGAVVGVEREPAELRHAGRRARGRRVRFVRASAYDLPFGDAVFDAALAHAVLEHLAQPAAALAELGRALRPGGILGAACSDWSAAVVEPRTADVDEALAAHEAARRRAGGDPHAGSWLAALVGDAGFDEVTERRELRSDMTYAGLAAYVAGRLEAVGDPAAGAAHRWAANGPGRFEQCWVCVTARRR